MSQLTEQVQDAAKQAAAAARTSPTDSPLSSQPTETDSSTISAVELPTYLKGQIDEAAFAKLPEEQQKQLVNMGKSIYDDYQSKTKEFAPLRKFQKELAENPSKADFIRRAVDAFDKGENPFETAAQTRKAEQQTKNLFSDLKKHEDPAVREQAVALEESIMNMIHDGAASKSELEELRSMVKELRTGSTELRTNTIREQLSKFGKAWSPLIEKYEDDILSYSVKYPKVSLKKVIALVSDEEEFATAVRADSVKDIKQETERAKVSATSKPSAAVGGQEGLIKDEDIQKSRSAVHGNRIKWRGPIGRMLPDILAKARSQT